MIRVKMLNQYRFWIFGMVFFAWISGICLFSALEWGEIEGEFGIEPSPYLGILLKLHGISAFCFLISFGFFLGTHVQNTWRMKKNRISGYGFITAQVFMIITGYLLYYMGWNFLRYLHFAIGFSLPFLIGIHTRNLIQKIYKKITRAKHKNDEKKTV